jgi:hypothetical protein
MYEWVLSADFALRMYCTRSEIERHYVDVLLGSGTEDQGVIYARGKQFPALLVQAHYPRSRI